MGRKRSKSSQPKNEIELTISTAAAATATETAPPSSPSPPWIELPEDVTANILQRLGAEEILESAQKVCSTWRKVCKDPAMWRVVNLKNVYEADDMDYVLLCQCAVDHSQGGLIDLRVASFEDPDLITYIADRASHLRRLTFSDCDLPVTILIQALKILPELEELHLIMVASVSADDIATIGITFPMLKSFTFNEHWCEYPEEYSDDDDSIEGYYSNEHAFAIAKTMNNLRHLRLFTQRFENEGLEAILDGCPHLESLDLRQCFGLELEGALGKRCSEQIKHPRLPDEPIDDVELPVRLPDFNWDESSLSGISPGYLCALIMKNCTRSWPRRTGYDDAFHLDGV